MKTDLLCPFCRTHNIELWETEGFGTVRVLQCDTCKVRFVMPWYRTNDEIYDFWNKRFNMKGNQNMKWISVRKSVPADQEEVLVCTRSKKGLRNIDKGYHDGKRFVHRGTAEVTHWMPLPDLPEEG